MKIICSAVAALLIAWPAWAQSVDELKRQLAEKEAQVQQLRQRIEVLERELTPRRIKTAQTAPALPEDEREDSNRALERALVRESGLLLPARRFEVEPNLVYSHSSGNGNGFRRDSYGPGLVLRAGLPWRAQLELAVPYVIERRRSAGAPTTDADGIGDVSVALSRQLLSERAGVPGLIATAAYLASTGKNTVYESATPVALGSGFDAAQLALTAIKRVDPLVFFGSYSFIHQFSDNRAGARVEPGNSHGLRIGTALASGPDTSLRAAFAVTYFDKTRIDGVKIPTSDDPSALLELGGSLVLDESTLLDVVIGAGLTRTAPDYRISIAVPVRF